MCQNPYFSGGSYEKWRISLQYESQQSGAVIWAVIRKSQCARHAVMENRNMCAINQNIAGYLCTWWSIKKGDQTPKNETCNRVLRIPCNLSDLVKSLSPSLPRGFFSLGFSRNSPVTFALHSHFHFECR